MLEKNDEDEVDNDDDVLPPKRLKMDALDRVFSLSQEIEAILVGNDPVMEKSYKCGHSIIIDDFDSVKESCSTICTSNKETQTMPEVSLYQPQQKPYTRQSSDASIKKILEEAEHRKNEFWKLIDEHEQVIENLKKIELEHSGICKIAPTVIST
ncbi:hypothetical protein QE152_g6853 [Popillia japonica]|uniref:Uncharacterized protein n=1 Tax=Popillia japonica TaxID=7064 RepID=A0AAW1MIQ4_POPJA